MTPPPEDRFILSRTILVLFTVIFFVPVVYMDVLLYVVAVLMLILPAETMLVMPSGIPWIVWLTVVLLSNICPPQAAKFATPVQLVEVAVSVTFPVQVQVGLGAVRFGRPVVLIRLPELVFDILAKSKV